MESRANPSPEEMKKMIEKAQRELQEALDKLTPEERAQAEMRAKQMMEEDAARLHALVDEAAKAAAGSPPKTIPKFCSNCGAPAGGGKFCAYCGSPL